MLRFIQAAFFDVDGVLIDSLPQHLELCRDKAKEFQINLKVPSIDEFRAAVSAGVKVSPMLDFFLAIGFPEEDANRAVATYDKEFATRYHPPAFEGVDSMLRALRDQGARLGIVTSNTRENVTPVLAESLDAFDHSCLFFYDKEAPPRPKSSCLTEGARRLGLLPANCVYVGDQPADLRAAEAARCHFLGVTYGWGLLAGDSRFPAVGSVDEIPKKIVDIDTKLVTR